MASFWVIFAIGLVLNNAWPASANFTHTYSSESLEEACASLSSPTSSRENYETYFFSVNLDDHSQDVFTNESNMYSPTSESELDNCADCIVYGFDGPYMKIRKSVKLEADPFMPDPKCKISLQELEGIVRIFRQFIDGRQRAPDTDDGDDVPAAATADECRRNLEVIKTNSKELTDLYEQMKNSKGISPEEYHKLSNSYEEKLKNLNSHLERAIKQADQKAKTLVDEVRQEMDEIRRKMNEQKELLDKSLENEDRLSARLVGYDIIAGKHYDARRHFEKIRDKRKMLPELMDTAYAVENIDNIIIFTKRMITREDMFMVVGALVDKLVERRQQTPMTLVVHAYVSRLYRFYPNKSPLKESVAKLERPVDAVINGFAAETLAGSEKSSVKEFARGRNEVFAEFVPKWVAAVWGKPNSGDAEGVAYKLIEFVNWLPRPTTPEFAKYLFHEMFKSNEVPLGPSLYLANSLIAYSGDKRCVSNHPDFYFLLNIALGEPFSLLNYYTNNFLRTAGQYKTDRIQVEASKAISDGSFWKFYPMTNRKDYVIRTATPQSQWLYAATSHHAYNGEQRRVLAWAPGGQIDEQGVWQLRDADWRKRIFLLWNKDSGEFLNDDENGRVFTWRKDGMGPSPKWHFAAPFPYARHC